MAKNRSIHTPSLAMAAFDCIPTVKQGAKHITALVKKNGRITGYQLDDGAILSKQECIALAKKGGVAGVGIAHRRDTEYLKAIPDERGGNNLSNLPTISD